MPNESQTQSPITPPTQPVPTPTPQDSAQKPKGLKNPLPIIITLAALAILGIGASIFAFIQTSIKDSEISDLKSQLGSSQDKPNDNTDNSNNVTDPTQSPQNIFLLSDALGRHPYHIAVKPEDSNANAEWPSNKDQFYLLNMNKLGTDDALQPFDLAGVLQPTIDSTIASSLPDSSTSATGGITTRSQCNSFDIFYTDPLSDSNQRPLFMPMPNEYNPETDVPVTTNYFCHTDNYDVVYLKATYIININNQKISTYSTNSNFYNQN